MIGLCHSGLCAVYSQGLLSLDCCWLYHYCCERVHSAVVQVVEVIDLHARDQRLLDLLQKYHSNRTDRIIIFVLYKKEAPRVEALLKRKGWKAAAIHGDINQGQRTAAVESFKDGSIPLLIATDVAARGLDIPDVEVVINYSFPLTIEDYVHRIGRTGRAGKSGRAHTFFCASMDKPRAGAERCC